MLLIGDALSRLQTIPADSIHCCVTSPPYWGLRDYGTRNWFGGDPACEHDREVVYGPHHSGQVEQTKWSDAEAAGKGGTATTASCSKCGAWWGQLGLEPTPEAYVQNIVAIFKEVRRALHPSGTLWCNLGDSYASQGISDGLKAKDLVGIPWMVAFALRADGWYLRSDIIWCLSGGTRVYARTQKGEMPMTIKDMVRLDPSTVELWNGTAWTQVLGWNESPRPEKPVEIVLRSGERITCTPGHRWPTQRGLLAASDLQMGDIIQTTGLPEPLISTSPECLPDEATGWFVGMYLAEGSRSKGQIQIAGHAFETDRLARLQAIAAMFGGTCNRHPQGGHKVTDGMYGNVLNAIIDTYVGGRIAKDKHLKSACWKRSNAFLHALLQGYLDGDGHDDPTNPRWRLSFTRNYALEADIRTLCARLGLHLSLRPTMSHYEGKRYPSFRGEIRFSRSGHHNEKHMGEIVVIRQGRARKFWDIGVADEPHLFALASGVLTHNSKGNCMPESVRDRPTRSHEYIFLLTKQARYFYDQDAIRETAATADPDDPSFRENGKSKARRKPIGIPPGMSEQHGLMNDLWRSLPLPMRPQSKRALELAEQHGLTQEHLDAIRAVGLADPGGKREKLMTGAGKNTEEVIRLAAEAKEVLGSYYKEFADVSGGRNKRSVWQINSQPYAEAHFATFPPALPEICIRAGTSEKGCCPTCKAPWDRVTEIESQFKDGPGHPTRYGDTDSKSAKGFAMPSIPPPDVTQLGWQPTCSCPEHTPEPCTVLDPFSGSGTTLMVATELRRKFIGIELNPEYAKLIDRRLDKPLTEEARRQAFDDAMAYAETLQE